jgi:hypothetical protein
MVHGRPLFFVDLPFQLINLDIKLRRYPCTYGAARDARTNASIDEPPNAQTHTPAQK